MNNIQYNKDSKFILKISSKNINDKNKYNSYMLKKINNNYFISPNNKRKSFLESALHLVVLNPFYIKYFYQYDGKSEFLKTQTHKNLIPIRIVYSIIIYGIVLIGLIKSKKNINDALNLFLLLSILYVILIGGWLGIPRYFYSCTNFYVNLFWKFF